MASVDEDILDDDDVLTVAELNERISESIGQTDELQGVRCLGEISDISEGEWGAFIDLVYDGHELSAVMWSSRYNDIEADLEPGMMVLVTGNIDYYAEMGRLNLKPWDVVVVGDGDRPFGSNSSGPSSQRVAGSKRATNSPCHSSPAALAW